MASSMAQPGYNKTVTCPFNSSHNIMKERFQTHLIKCAKNYPDIKLEKCPFNTTHLVHPNDLDEHVINCDDRASLDLYKYNHAAPASRKESKPEVAPTFVPPANTSGENWDDDDFPTYDPQTYVQSNPVIRTLNLAPPSARKAFKEAERLRLNNFPKKY